MYFKHILYYYILYDVYFQQLWQFVPLEASTVQSASQQLNNLLALCVYPVF